MPQRLKNLFTTKLDSDLQEMPNSSGFSRAPLLIRTSENIPAPNQDLSRVDHFVSARLLYTPLLAQ